jgi:hypothetical protein
MCTKFGIEQDRVIIKDNKRDRIAEVMVRNGELQCLLDEKTDCIHIEFVYSLPEIYKSLRRKALFQRHHNQRHLLSPSPLL